MLEIGKNNIFLGNSDSYKGMSEIIDKYELSGKNQILFYKEESNFHHWVKIKKVKIESDFEKTIFENLFRIDLILIDDPNIYSLYSIRNITDIPIILIKKDDKIISSFTKFNNIYKFTKSKSENKFTFKDIENEIIIEDSINNWSSSIQSLKQKWIREEKIKEIFKSK